MLLIADSGSTKTTWCLTGDSPDERDMVETQGINPVHQSEEQIHRIIADELLSQAGSRMTKGDTRLQVFFYGAGCIGDACDCLKTILSDTIGSVKSAAIEVETDLLGAARALCGRQQGIACILGTGSNSCWYDGKMVVDNVPPLGYILGDEGSGAVLGRQFFNAMFKGRLPETVKVMYQKESGLNYSDIINRIYRQPLANRFLASTSVFIHDNMQSYPELRQLVVENFRQFFRNNVARYDKSTCHFIGSMASVYEPELREAAALEGYTVGRVEKSPMEGLIRYHSPHYLLPET